MGRKRKKKAKLANIKIKAREFKRLDIPKPKTKLERGILSILFPNFLKRTKKKK